MSLAQMLLCSRYSGQSLLRSSFVGIHRKISVLTFRFKGINGFLRNLPKKKKPNFGSLTLQLSCTGLGLIGYKLHTSVVLCETKTTTTTTTTRLVDDLGKKSDPEFQWKQFWKYLKPHWLWLLAAVASAIAVAILNIQIPQLLGDVVNVVSEFIRRESNSQGDREAFFSEIRGPALDMIKLYAAQSLMTFVYIFSLSNLGERVAANLRKDLFAAVVKQDIAFFDEHKSGEIVTRLAADVQEFKSSFKSCISQGLRSSTQILGCSVSLYLISPQMTGLMMIVVPTIIVTGTVIGSFLRSLSKRAQAQVGRAMAVGEECIGNIRTVRAFAMEDPEMNLYSREVDEARKLSERLGFGIGLFQGATNMFLNGIVLSTLCFGGYLMANQNLTPGQLMSFLVATQTIQRSLTQLSLLFGQFVKGVSSGARVFEYMNLEPTIPIEGGKKIPYHNFFGEIEFRNIDFSYPGRPDQKVLQDFSLKIRPGTMVALVGSSGGGKSTIAALLERFYDVDGGSITLDGYDVRKLDPKWLRGSAIGYISQEPVLFATSVMENIRYGRTNATDLEVMEAAKNANAHEFIKGFPEGYSTILGERGVTVSGGQKQRIAIARALLKNPSILILDEATSALDAESEKIVQDALDTLTKGRTVLVIAHRLSTVRDASTIAVLSGGRILEKGTHEELKRKKGIYYELIRQQQERKDDRTQG